MAEENVAHQPGGVTVLGIEEFRQFYHRVLEGFPDQQMKILHAVGDDTQACIHWEVSGTHEGDFFGVAPTHQKVSFDGMSFITVADGKITEAWDSWDMGSLMASLAKA